MMWPSQLATVMHCSVTPLSPSPASNRVPPLYESGALPNELDRQVATEILRRFFEKLRTPAYHRATSGNRTRAYTLARYRDAISLLSQSRPDRIRTCMESVSFLLIRSQAAYRPLPVQPVIPAELFCRAAKVAVSTPDVALGDFLHDALQWVIGAGHAGDIVGLLGRIPVVKLENYWIRFTAVNAWMSFEVLVDERGANQEGGASGRANRISPLRVAGVDGPVVRSLAFSAPCAITGWD